MGKAQSFQGLDKLAGKKVVLKPQRKYDLVRVKSMVKAQQGTIVEDLDKHVDYLVVSDLSGGVGVQKQAAGLNAKGAHIQVMDGDAMVKLLTPTQEELIGLLRLGAAGARQFNEVFDHSYAWGSTGKTSLTVAGESFEGCQMEGFGLMEVCFDGCRFGKATLASVDFGRAVNCDFSEVTPRTMKDAERGHGISFGDVENSRFARGQLEGVSFNGALGGADFSGAQLKDAEFGEHYYGRRGKRTGQAGVVFAGADLQGARFNSVDLVGPNFERINACGAIFSGCDLQQARFAGANLEGASFVSCKLKGADFSGANLKSANLGDSDISDASVTGADLAACALRGATAGNVDFSKAKNYDPNASVGGAAGPSLLELDKVVGKAKRVEVSFRVRADGDTGEGDAVGVNSSGLRYGWGMQVPHTLHSALYATRHSSQPIDFSDAMLKLAGFMGSRKVRFETVDISSTKAPTQGKELRDLMLKAISEAFGQPVPAEDELAAATKAYRDKDREKNAVQREQREKEKAAAEKVREKEKKQAEKKIEKAVGGKVKDISTFLTALELRIEKPKIDKATSMLKKSGFQLYNDITDTFMSGVVKSQTDPDLVYACRINHDGTYACCTQNLNICGGLRGSICKHLLVLIIGLVKAGTLDPTTIDGWVAKSMHEKAALDKEKMGEIFIKYKGAEAGEVDWRPTETLPEDYYAV